MTDSAELYMKLYEIASQNPETICETLAEGLCDLLNRMAEDLDNAAIDMFEVATRIMSEAEQTKGMVATEQNESLDVMTAIYGTLSASDKARFRSRVMSPDAYTPEGTATDFYMCVTRHNKSGDKGTPHQMGVVLGAAIGQYAGSQSEFIRRTTECAQALERAPHHE